MTEDSTSTGKRAFGYRPHLDGLRVVAVYLVVAFHGGADGFVGGFIGVDLFFVLSGFLVTHVLLRDLDSTGSIRFGRFYARRFRRLLPAAAVVLVVSAVLYSALASPLEVAQAEGGFRAAFLYVANWYFIDQSNDYFAADLATNPVLHFWSLAVEEQFYLVWPVLLGGLFAITRRLGPRHRQVVTGVVLAGAAASLAWAWSLRDADPLRAFFGTDARAYQLLAGAALALGSGWLARAGRFALAARVVAVAALMGLVVVATSSVELGEVERGLAATALSVVAIVALEAAGGGVARRVLSLAPVVYLGRISYGTYLWHWPVVWVMARTFELSEVTTVALTAVIATALASLSFELLEHPIRASSRLDRHRAPVIATGLAISVAGALLVIPAVVDRARPTTELARTDAEVSAAGSAPIPSDAELEAIVDDMNGTYFPPACEGDPATDCIRFRGGGRHVLLMGDSHAAMIIPAIREVARSNDLTFSVAVMPGCPWQRRLAVSDALADRAPSCQEMKENLYERIIPELDPDLIVVMNGGYEISPGSVTGLKYTGPDGEPLELGSPELEAWLDETTQASLDELLPERDVVVMEPTPLEGNGFSPYECLFDATVVEECRFVAAPGPTALELAYRALAADRDRLWTVDLDRLVCPYLPICDPIVDEVVVMSDESHLTGEFALGLAPAIEAYLRDNGLLA